VFPLLVVLATLFVISLGPAAHAQNALVVAKGVQTGTVVFGTGSGQVDAATTTLTLGKPVDEAKTFVHCTFSTNQSQPITRPTCELTSTTLVITLGTSVASSAHTTVRWHVNEFEGNVLVQRGLVTFTNNGADGGTDTTEPFNGTGAGALTLGTAVDCTKSFVLTTERINLASTIADEQWQASATLVTSTAGSAPRAVCTSGTTTALELLRNEVSTSPLKVAWQVVQIDGITVQRGQSCIGGTGTPNCPLVGAGATQGASQNATLTTIDTAKSFVLTSQRAGSAMGGEEREYRVRSDFSSTTNLRFTRGATITTSNHQIQLTWEVVSLNDRGRVERNAFARPR
jgi:hypothetical protein